MTLFPYTTLFRSIFELRLVVADQCSGCVSFIAVKERESDFLSFGSPRPSGSFRRHWVWMDAGWRREELQKPYAPATERREWSAQALAGDLLHPMVEKVKTLRDAGLTAEMVVAEFLRRRLAPLQAHERALWDCSGRDDEMRLEDKRLPSESFNQLMSLLFGTVWNTQLPAGATPLYCPGAQQQHNMPTFKIGRAHV